MGLSRRDAQLYTVLFDVDPPARDRWLRWYEGRHAPDLLAAGFLGFHAYRSIRGNPGFVTVWEQDHDVLQTPAYAAARLGDPDLAANESAVRSLRKGTYRQVPIGLSGPPPPLDSEWLGLLGFDLPELDQPDLVAWLAEPAPPGGERRRLAVRLAGHPLFPGSVAPRLLLLVEAAVEPAGLDDLRARLAERFPMAAVGTLTVGRRYQVLTR